MRHLRFEGETDREFLQRAERCGRYARLLADACLGNHCVQRYIADPMLPTWTEERARRCPTVRIEYEQAVAIGGIGETLRATLSKSWGHGPSVLPLLPEDEFFPNRITYVYRKNSLYNRRFEQRKRMKELLGRRYRGLVSAAQSRYTTKEVFLRHLQDEEAAAIRRILNVEPGEFWRACKGKSFLNLPQRLIQLWLFPDNEE